MESITDLINTIDRLPAADRADAVAVLEAILEMREGPRELALGLLALDLAPYAIGATTVIDVPELVSA